MPKFDQKQHLIFAPTETLWVGAHLPADWKRPSICVAVDNVDDHLEQLTGTLEPEACCMNWGESSYTEPFQLKMCIITDCYYNQSYEWKAL